MTTLKMNVDLKYENVYIMTEKGIYNTVEDEYIVGGKLVALLNDYYNTNNALRYLLEEKDILV